jgi:hypothetical protein
MLTLKVLSTGSQGNCYLLQSGEETLDCDAAVAEAKKIAGNAFVDYARAGETYCLENGGCSF